MILPDGHEKMTDAELIELLVEAGIYDREGAEAVVAMIRVDVPGVVVD